MGIVEVGSDAVEPVGSAGTGDWWIWEGLVIHEDKPSTISPAAATQKQTRFLLLTVSSLENLRKGTSRQISPWPLTSAS
jgi:hypothetical protein